MKRILVAGASGRLGQIVVQQLKNADHHVRVLCRSKERWERSNVTADEIVIADLMDPETLNQCGQNIDAVISCAGASMDVKRLSDRLTFNEVDYCGNKHLLEASKRSGVKKFIYVSVAGAEKFPKSEYCAAHHRFEQELLRSGLEHTIIKPTGFFYFFREMLSMAKKGRGIVFGDGSARTNPIHEEDVAGACIDAVNGTVREIIAGGPEIFTRKQIVELAFASAGTVPKITTVSPRLFAAATFPMKFINPRIHALLEFGSAVSTHDVIFDPYGKRTLAEYFRTINGETAL